jgi:hypothetical protein
MLHSTNHLVGTDLALWDKEPGEFDERMCTLMEEQGRGACEQHS